MTERIYAKLSPSEMAIFQVAGNIFSSYVASGKVNDTTEKHYVDLAVSLALALADKVDKSVQSDEETTHGR